MKLRNGLLLGSAFAIGLAAGPLAGRIAGLPEGPFSLGMAALAQEVPASAADSGNHAEIARYLVLFGQVLDLARAKYVEPVSVHDLINNALSGMISGLDPHSSYMTEKQYGDMKIQTTGNYGGLGIEVQGQDGHIRIVAPFDGSPAARAGLKPGDYIVAVNGHDVDGQPVDTVVQTMKGKPGEKIAVTVLREKAPKPITVTMTREIIHLQVVRSALYGNIGYIRVSQFTEETEARMHEAFDKLKAQADAKGAGGKLQGLVLDLRSDPGGLLNQAIAVSDDFIPEGQIVSIRARDPHEDQRWDARGTDMTNHLPIVVLIDGGTASAAEIVAGALQDHRRAVLLGTKSFGKGSVQTIFPFPGYGAVRLTTARYYTPSGRSIQGLGIVPDIAVKDSRSDPGFSVHEADLAHIIKNEGGNRSKPVARTDLPAIAGSIPDEPPANWPDLDLTKPDTDFQLQEGLRVVRSMAGLPAPDVTANATPPHNAAAHAVP